MRETLTKDVIMKYYTSVGKNMNRAQRGNVSEGVVDMESEIERDVAAGKPLTSRNVILNL